MRVAGILVIASLLLAACGQKGPLYLPPPPALPTSQPTAPVTPPAESRKPDRPFPDVPATTDK